MCFYYQCIFNKTDCWCDMRCSCLAKKKRWIKQTRCMKNSSFIVADFADGIDHTLSPRNPFNRWMLKCLKEYHGSLHQSKKLLSLCPRYVSPTCDSTHVCTPWKGSTDTGLSTVRRKAGCVLRISYSYIIDNGMDEIANKSHNTFCVTVFYVKQKMLRQNWCPTRSSKKSIATKAKEL